VARNFLAEFISQIETPLRGLGIMNATVNYECQTATLPLLVVSGIGASLMGCNWLEQLTLSYS